MTCTVIREEGGEWPGRLKEMIFSCDHAGGCDVKATDAEIEPHGGLNFMGWETGGGKHYCPEHRLTPMATPALLDISRERQRQITAEGFAPEDDDRYTDGALAKAAACYAMGPDVFHGCMDGFWPWEREWWKSEDRRRNLVKAGALIAAEIERLDRKGKTNDNR